MKFKTGDKVVVAKLDALASPDYYKYIGKTVTVSEVFSGAEYGIFIDEFRDASFSEYELVFEEVYNSPLYQALL